MGEEHTNHPQLKHFMQEAKPESVDAHRLLVVYDADFEESHAKNVMAEMPLIERCLHRIVGVRGMRVEIRIEKGVAAVEDEIDDADKLAEVRAKIEKTPFVQEVVRLFNGKIIDVRG